MAQVPIVVPQYEQQAQVQPVNPLDSVAKALGIANSAQNLKAGGIALQQHEQAQKDDQDIRSAAQQANGDPDKIYELLSTTNPRAAATFGQELATRRKTEADTLKDQLDNAQKQIGIIGSAAQSVKDDNSLQLAKKQVMSALGPNAASLLGDTYDENRIKQITDSALSHKDWLDSQQKAIENAREAQKLANETGEAKDKARASWEQSIAHAVVGTQSQDDFDRALNTYKILGAPQDLLALYGQAWSPEVRKKAAAVIGPEAQKVENESGPGGTLPQTRDEANQQLSDIFGGKKDDPTYKIYAQRLANLRYSPTAGAALLKEAQGETQNVRQDIRKKENDSAVAAEAAKAKSDFETGGNLPELANVPPGMRKDVADKAAKVKDDFASAQQAADDMKTFIDQARKGNKIAYSYAPTEGVLTLNTGRGVKRVNMAEIGSYSGAGSLADSVKAKLGKLASGASIPADLLADMESLHQAVLSNAQTSRDRKLKNLDDNYHSKYAPATTDSTDKKNPFRPE